MKSSCAATLSCIFVLLFSSRPATWGAPILNPNNGHYYEYIGTAASWNDSQIQAAATSFLGLNGHLATITSLQEQTFVYNSIVQPNLPNTRSYAAWLGGFQLAGSPEPAEGWFWTTGENWTYANWGGGEPNNGGGGENALAIWGDGTWNDFIGSTFGAPDIGPVGYVIEYSVPEPNQVVLTMVLSAMIAVSRRKLHARKFEKISTKPRLSAPE